MGRKDRTFEGCGLGLGPHGPHPCTVSLVSCGVWTRLFTRRHDGAWRCQGVKSLSFATEAQGAHPERARLSDLRPCWGATQRRPIAHWLQTQQFLRGKCNSLQKVHLRLPKARTIGFPPQAAHEHAFPCG